MEPNEVRTEEKDLFDDMKYRLVRASMGKRFLNYLVDLFVFYLLFMLGLIILGNVSPATLNAFVQRNQTEISLLDELLILVLYGTYLFITEALFNGKTLGKLFTGTRVVRQDGTPMTVRDAQLRGLSRMVPFNVFSALGNPPYPWHDRWTKTYVIDEKQSHYVKEG